MKTGFQAAGKRSKKRKKKPSTKTERPRSPTKNGRAKPKKKETNGASEGTPLPVDVEVTKKMKLHPELQEGVLEAVARYGWLEGQVYKLLIQETPGPFDATVILTMVLSRICVQDDLPSDVFTSIFRYLHSISVRAKEQVALLGSQPMPRA